jgi:MtfA peptidase
MPPDTIYIPGQTSPPPEEFVNWDSIIQIHTDSNTFSDSKAKDSAGDGTSIFFLLLFGLLMAVITNGFEMLPAYIKRKRLAAKITKLIGEKGAAYHQLLLNYNPYYDSLSEELKHRFLERTIHFAESKEFRFHSIAGEEHIPVLISGAAIQLTFGLKNYLLDYFDIIHVMKSEYVLNIDNETYFGHVSKNGIHISWSHFLKGYKDYTDAVNVGLHEMAHALQFDAYLGYENQYDKDFKERLNSFSEEGRPVFRAMRAGLSMVFDDYAMTNFDEFWAVSVESFFENPVAFKKKLPVLYKEMCQLLNQDPLLQNKIIDPDLL